MKNSVLGEILVFYNAYKQAALIYARGSFLKISVTNSNQAIGC